MALKKAIATFVKENGETVTRQFTIKSVVFHYQEGRIETIYEVYPSEAARHRGAAPEYVSQSVPVDFSTATDIQMVLAVSDRIWEKNAAEAFISDYSEVDENGKQKQVVKSFNDLSAEIIDVEV